MRGRGVREVHSHREGERGGRTGTTVAAALRLVLSISIRLLIDRFPSAPDSGGGAAAAGRGGAPSWGDGTRVNSPGAGRSLAEKETRKRTASCATRKLTLANCWLIFILMNDQRVRDLDARGERARPDVCALYSALKRALALIFHSRTITKEEALQPVEAQQLAC